MRTINMIELFGGVGAPRMALRNLGYNINSVYIEIDEHATNSYNAIFNENHKPTSVTNVKGAQGYDIIFHGSPCQDFTTIGTGYGGEQGSGTRSSLMWETVRIVSESLPKIVIWENVVNTLGSKHIGTFKKYLQAMEELGYKNSYRVLDSADFNVAQNRKRVFVVSCIDSHFDFHLEDIERTKLWTDSISWDDYNFKKFEDVTNRQLRAMEKLKCITDGDLFLYDIWESAEFLSKGRTPLEPARTLLARGTYGIYHRPTNSYRKLEPIEYWRLMGFNDEDFYKAQKVCSNVQLYKQAGNSIVVPVLEAIFKELLV